MQGDLHRDCRSENKISGNKKQAVIVIDSSDDGRAKQIAKVLTQEHALTCYVVNGGFDAWKRNKLPTSAA